MEIPKNIFAKGGCASAKEAQKLWELAPLSKRTKWLKNFQQLIAKKSDEIIVAIQADTQKPSMEARGIEIASVLMTAHYYRKNLKKFLKPRRAGTHWMFKNKTVWVRQAPYGVVAILGPSNLPFSLTIGDAIPALMAGNAVIIKPSERTPKSAQLGAALALEAGLPQNLLQIIEGDGEVGSQLIDQADCIFFTGSTTVGKKVAAQAAQFLKPCILELGGKAPMIILDDADLERAARACVWGRFAHSGQHCIAVERVYVDYKIAQNFIDAVVTLTKTLTPQELSPLTAPKTAGHLEELIEDAVKKGAQIAWQNEEKKDGPIILTNCNHTMRVMKEETFGPILPIMIFNNFQNLIHLANDTETGLSASIFTKNKKQALTLARLIEAGNITVNDMMDSFMIMDAPFGGWKNSGLGVRHSREGILQFTRSQTILSHSFALPKCKAREFWWFPYEAKNESLLKRLVQFFFS